MIVGVAKEIKNNEFRVGMTPSGVEAMRRAGHTVLIEASAGVGSGFTDADYKAVGAEIVSDSSGSFTLTIISERSNRAFLSETISAPTAL